MDPPRSKISLACYDCNRAKGPNLASVDPLSGESAFLFNPRKNIWTEHFRLDGAIIVGLTPMGRATAALLQFNNKSRVRLRMELQRIGRYPMTPK